MVSSFIPVWLVPYDTVTALLTRDKRNVIVALVAEAMSLALTLHHILDIVPASLIGTSRFASVAPDDNPPVGSANTVLASDTVILPLEVIQEFIPLVDHDSALGVNRVHLLLDMLLVTLGGRNRSDYSRVNNAGVI